MLNQLSAFGGAAGVGGHTELAACTRVSITAVWSAVACDEDKYEAREAVSHVRPACGGASWEDFNYRFEGGCLMRFFISRCVCVCDESVTRWFHVPAAAVRRHPEASEELMGIMNLDHAALLWSARGRWSELWGLYWTVAHNVRRPDSFIDHYKPVSLFEIAQRGLLSVLAIKTELLPWNFFTVHSY